MSIAELAKLGRYDELRSRATAGENVELAVVFERAVTDFRSVRRNPGHQRLLQWCVDEGLDLNARGGWLNQSLICLAAAAGNNEIVAYMLRQPQPSDPIVWASLGEVELLRHHAATHELAALEDANGFNLLFNAAQSGLGRRDDAMKQRLTDVCRLLLEQGVSPRVEVNLALPVFPAFLCAASGGNAQVMDLLLDAAPLSPDRCGQVVEHCLEPHQRSGEPFYDVAACVLAHGYDVNAPRSDQGRSLLHGAANRGTTKAVRWLLENGADPNGLDARGRTPLHVCAHRNTSTAIARLLTAAGSQSNAADSSGKTALDYARTNQRAQVAEYLASLDPS